MVNRSDDLYEILNDANGMNAAGGLKPTLQMYEDAENIGQYYTTNHNTLLIKQYSFERKFVRHTSDEQQIWTVPCLLIAESWDKLEDYLDEVRRVVNKYNSAPWAENSHTYDYLDIINHGPTSENERWKYNCEFTVLMINWCEVVAT